MGQRAPDFGGLVRRLPVKLEAAASQPVLNELLVVQPEEESR